MRQQTDRIFLHYLLYLLVVCLCAGPVAAAVAPDPHIESELKALFADPPDVRGFPYQKLMEEAASRYGLPLPYVLAVARGESFFDPRAKSSQGAIGLMQVMPSTGAKYGLKREELLDPGKNIDAGVHYLADLYARLRDPYLALAAYYCGMGKDTFTLRKDCDEYVHYIYSHLQRVLASAKTTGPVIQGKNHFVLTCFDNFLDAQNFICFLTRKIPDIQLDIFRSEVVFPDHVRYQYQVLAAYGKENERPKICRLVEEKTGFSLCDQTGQVHY